MVHWIHDDAPLPRPGSVPEEVPGLVAAGGRLSTDRLAQAYRQGLFPWFGPGQPVLWWSPDPRMLLPVADFRLSRSLRKTLQRFLVTPGCRLRFDGDVRAVITACAKTPREGQDGTWIVPAMVDAYCRWHAQGRVHSVETWVDGRCVGGLYFVSLGRMVFGESMFSHRSDASKLALAALVAACLARGVAWIDCQQQTGHLASLGAQAVTREDFQRRLSLALGGGEVDDWSYDPAHWALLDPRLPVAAGGAGPAEDHA
jgi:leucyl/phenylalanyl-tRNA---protein transferase